MIDKEGRHVVNYSTMENPSNDPDGVTVKEGEVLERQSASTTNS